MIFDDTHPDALDIRVLDPHGNQVGKIKSLDVATGQAVRYATDAAGHVIFDTVPVNPLGRTVLDIERAGRVARTEHVHLAGHRVEHRDGTIYGTTPSQPAA